MFNLFNKTKPTTLETNLTDESTNTKSEESDWEKNLSWSDDLMPEEIYIKSYQKPLDTDKIISAVNIAATSSRVYSTMPKDDTKIVIFVKKLENFPTTYEIDLKRNLYNSIVEKLTHAKKAMNTLTADQHDGIASLILANTTIDSELRHAMVEQRSYEAKLAMEIKSIEEFLESFKDDKHYEKAYVLAQMYGFERLADNILSHEAFVDKVIIDPVSDSLQAEAASNIYITQDEPLIEDLDSSNDEELAKSDET